MATFARPVPQQRRREREADVESDDSSCASSADEAFYASAQRNSRLKAKDWVVYTPSQRSLSQRSSPRSDPRSLVASPDVGAFRVLPPAHDGQGSFLNSEYEVTPSSPDAEWSVDDLGDNLSWPASLSSLSSRDEHSPAPSHRGTALTATAPSQVDAAVLTSESDSDHSDSAQLRSAGLAARRRLGRKRRHRNAGLSDKGSKRSNTSSQPLKSVVAPQKSASVRSASVKGVAARRDSTSLKRDESTHVAVREARGRWDGMAKRLLNLDEEVLEMMMESAVPSRPAHNPFRDIEEGETALHAYIRATAMEDEGEETETESRPAIRTRRSSQPILGIGSGVLEGEAPRILDGLQGALTYWREVLRRISGV